MKVTSKKAAEKVSELMQKKKRTDDKIRELKALKDAELEKKIVEMMKPEKKTKKPLKI